MQNLNECFGICDTVFFKKQQRGIFGYSLYFFFEASARYNKRIDYEECVDFLNWHCRVHYMGCLKTMVYIRQMFDLCRMGLNPMLQMEVTNGMFEIDKMINNIQWSFSDGSIHFLERLYNRQEYLMTVLSNYYPVQSEQMDDADSQYNEFVIQKQKFKTDIYAYAQRTADHFRLD